MNQWRKLSGPQLRVLDNLFDGRDAGEHLRGRSEYGGHDSVIRSLARMGLVVWDRVGTRLTTLVHSVMFDRRNARE